ncbi:hypothetical protein D0Y65_020016 [Glycine soja]|uniref:Uncharacterized protein n=1 Tax=Glycine soja TaxID=3848 RepID=A0A445JBZ5_GLYSO|nr:hypothetical protein D0Y65_020016 [Glycine soja]
MEGLCYLEHRSNPCLHEQSLFHRTSLASPPASPLLLFSLQICFSPFSLCTTLTSQSHFIIIFIYYFCLCVHHILIWVKFLFFSFWASKNLGP